MLSVIIKNCDEPNVIKLTYENLFKELRPIAGSELLVADDWLDELSTIKNKYVCLVESDCLVSSGYFASQMGLFKKNQHMRKLAMLSSAVGINTWGNRFYGYQIGNNYSDGLIPVREQHSRAVYPVQMGFVPGSVIRLSMLKAALRDKKIQNTKDINLIRLSAMLSIAFWEQGDGNRVHINPNTTYVTTEDYVGDISDSVNVDASKVLGVFKREAI